MVDAFIQAAGMGNEAGLGLDPTTSLMLITLRYQASNTLRGYQGFN